MANIHSANSDSFIFHENSKTEPYYTTTTNNAISLNTSNNKIVDFFMMMGRDLSDENLDKYMEDCCKINPHMTMALLYNARDRKNGKKEKNVSNRGMLWLINNRKYNTYDKNIETYINKYGCWKDLLYIMTKMPKNSINNEIELIGKQLIKDKKDLDENPDAKISLCAKWAPSENNHYDKKRGCARKIANFITNYDKKALEIYRKEYLKPLRDKINIVESLMCKKKWEDIIYEQVPGVACNRLKGAFLKHDTERYNKYLSEVRSGEKTINVTGILPHELVNHYLKDNEYNESIELQWKTILKNIQELGLFDKLLPVVDVSGSMFSANNGSIPAQVSIAMGILISQCTKGVFAKKVITFSETPKFHEIRGESLYEQVKDIKEMDWGGSTNFESVSDLIIDMGIKYRLSDNDMPKKIVVLSDMQFNQAQYNAYNAYNNDNDNKIELLYETINKKYKTHNYSTPKFIYWNLNSDNNNTFPVDISTNGTALISGFSEQLLKIFMEYDDFTPELVINGILSKYMADVYIDMNEFK